MEALAQETDIGIGNGTKRLILEMINSIRSVIPSGSGTEPTEKEMEVRAEKLDGYVQEVIGMAEANPGLLSGIFNIEELKTYLRYSRDFMEISEQLQDLMITLRNQYDKTNFLTLRLAACVREYLDMVSPGNPDDGLGNMMTVVHNDGTENIRRNVNDLKIKY